VIEIVNIFLFLGFYITIIIVVMMASGSSRKRQPVSAAQQPPKRARRLRASAGRKHPVPRMRSAIHGGGGDNLLASSTARSDDGWQVAIIAAQDNGAPDAPTTGQVLRATGDSRISLESLRSIGISDFSHGGWHCSGYFNASYVARGKSEGGTAGGGCSY